jgi:hypothetical protein
MKNFSDKFNQNLYQSNLLADMVKLTQFTLLLCFFFFLDVYSQEKTNLNQMRERVIWSYASYCQPEAVTHWNCFWCKQTPRLNIITFISEPKSATYVYIGHTQRNSN